MSAIVRMKPRAEATIKEAVDVELLSATVRVAFSQRRKLLRHSLGKWLDAKGFNGAFDTQRRAEEVPVSEYLNLVKTLSRQP